MNANEPAYPRTGVGNAGTMFDVPPQDGLTKREHAAILLRVPMSGDPEIDAMIIAANRKDAAAMAMQGLLANPNGEYISGNTIEDAANYIGIGSNLYKTELHYPLVVAKVAAYYADALLAQLAKEQA